MKLTKRQQQLFDLIFAGMTLKEAAHELHISRSTARGHFYVIRAKYGVDSMQELLLKVLRPAA